jgi:hypothetical protein
LGRRHRRTHTVKVAGVASGLSAAPTPQSAKLPPQAEQMTAFMRRRRATRAPRGLPTLGHAGTAVLSSRLKPFRR